MNGTEVYCGPSNFISGQILAFFKTVLDKIKEDILPKCPLSVPKINPVKLFYTL